MAATLRFLNTDARILDMIRRGEEDALLMLHSSNHRAVTAFVTRNSGTSDDAEDMLQEALVILWERVRAGRFTYNARLDTFVFATVRNIWFRQLARKRREVSGAVDPETHADHGPSVLDRLIDEEDAQRVQDALSRLGEPCRELLLLFYWEELSMQEIADRLGLLNAETAKSKKYQCKKALEQLLRQ
jgi:RNA polymerase sigma factor (sigma-70 family)